MSEQSHESRPDIMDPDVLEMDASHRAGRTQMTATVLSRVVRVLHRYLWTGRHSKAFFNEAGLHVVPANFYSTVPTVDEVVGSFEGHTAKPPYLDSQVFDEPSMLAFLEALCPFAAEFEAPVDSPSMPNLGDFYWENPAFSYSDAMAYYAIIRQRRPRRVIEVGSGFSTLVASAALERNGEGEIVCIEPEPRAFLRDVDRLAEVVEAPAQSLEPDWFDDRLADGDVFFIDSTHTVKIGSDCVHLYLRVLPAIRAAVMVHAHDIFLPFGFPPEWALDHHYYWTEQYLLMAFLLQNEHYRVRYGSHYHHMLHPGRLDALMHDRYPRGGSSLWFERGV